MPARASEYAIFGRVYLRCSRRAEQIAVAGNPLLDYQVKRQLYLASGVPEYWVVNPEARNVSRWRGRDDPGEVLSAGLEWMPAGMPGALVVDLPTLFAEALD